MSAPDKDRVIRNDGGPAFPHVNPDYDGNWDKEPQRAGMSIRDWFAGKAMLGYLSGRNAGDPNSGMWPDDVAADCYSYADAMLKERAK